MIDFELEPQLIELRERVARFVQEVAIPAEPRDVSTYGTDDALRSELREEAKGRGIQVRGATGVSGEGPLARLIGETRPFRIYDGPTETHLWSIARRRLRAHSARAAAPAIGS